jgi:hypothetical protein
LSTYRGDIVPGQTLRFHWNTNGASGASITRGTNGTIKIYKDGDTGTEVTTGVTDTEDSPLTGVHFCAIATTDTFYSAFSDYSVMLEGAVIDSQTVNACIATFSIMNRGLKALACGRFQAGSTSTTGVLAAAESLANDQVNGSVLVNVTTKEARLITDYVLATDTASVDPAWVTTPSASDIYVVVPSPPAPDTSVPNVKLTTTNQAEVADVFLGRNIAGGSSTGRTVETALAVLRNKVVVDRSAQTIVVYDTDDSTELWTGTIATESGNPIGTINPA